MQDFKGRVTGLCTGLERYKVQSRDQAGSHFETAFNAKNSSSDSESDFVAMFVPPSVKTTPAFSSLTSLDTSMAPLEQTSRRDLRTYECKSNVLLSAIDKTLSARRVLNATVQDF